MTVGELKEALNNFEDEDYINIVEAFEDPFETTRKGITNVFSIKDTNKDKAFNATAVYIRLDNDSLPYCEDEED